MANNNFNLLTNLSLQDADFKAGINRVKNNVKELITGVEGATGNLGEMRKALMALKNVSFAGKSVEEIRAINQQIGNLTDDMADLKAIQKGMGTEFGSTMAKGLQGVSAMAEVGVGIASMFGASKESAEKYQAVMVQLIGVSQAFATIQSLIEERTLQTIFAKVKDTAVTVSQTVATYAATAAQWALNASILVLVATIGAIIIVVAALVTGIYLLVKAHNTDTAEIERQTKAYDKLKSAKETDNDINQTALDILKAKGLEGSNLQKAELRNLQSQLANNKAQQEAIENIRLTTNLSKEQQEAQDKLNTEQLDLLNKISVKKAEIGKTADDEAKKVAENASKQKTAYEVIVESISKQEAAIKNILATGGTVSPDMIKKLEKEKDTLNLIDQTMSSIGSLSKNIKPITLTKKELTEVIGGKKKDEKQGLETDKLFGTKALIRVNEFNMALERSKETFEIYREALTGGFSEIGFSIVESLGIANDGMQGFAKVLLKFVVNTMAQFLGNAIAAAIAGASIAASFTGAAAIFTGPAFIASSVGAVLSAFAAIPKFENGGIIAGSSYSGDRIPIMANSGERILTAAQNSNFTSFLNGGLNGGLGGEVVFRIQGTELIGVITNTNRKIKSIR